jgi:hypothetical protein
MSFEYFAYIGDIGDIHKRFNSGPPDPRLYLI